MTSWSKWAMINAVVAAALAGPEGFLAFFIALLE
jgi:hypothetical protein